MGIFETDPGELTITRAKAARSCTVGAYYRLRPEISDYHVALNGVGTIYVSANVVRLPALSLFNLTEQLELDDNVAAVYRKSLLFLVSLALEREKNKPILGMQRYSEKLTMHLGLSIDYSNGKKGVIASTSHGGFDNDVKIMNTIMTKILKKAPTKPFTKEEMKGY